MCEGSVSGSDIAAISVFLLSVIRRSDEVCKESRYSHMTHCVTFKISACLPWYVSRRKPVPAHIPFARFPGLIPFPKSDPSIKDFGDY